MYAVTASIVSTTFYGTLCGDALHNHGCIALAVLYAYSKSLQEDRMKQIKKFATALLAIVMFATICPFGTLADTDRQRDETNAIPEAVADVIAAINALSPVENLAYDLDDLELATSAVNNAEALYDELSDEEKAMVSNYVILLEAKDVIAARQFEKLVYDRLGVLEEITLSNIPIVEEVHDAYDLLSTRQRSYVREYYITLFTDAINEP